MCKKVLLWGMGLDYEKLINAIQYEILKNNISVKAVVCRKSDYYCCKKDGFSIITKDDIWDYEFDYIVITSSQFFNEIRQEAFDLGVTEKQIISGDLFKQPLFDFKRYVSLIENPVTILSDDCWGGYAYNRLKLPFSSPLINIFWDRDEYAKFIQKPLFYLNTDLQMESDGDLEKGIYPIGRIGTATDSVTMKFVHNIDFAEAKEQWDRRRKRINPNNLFIKMGFSSNIDEEKCLKYISAFNSVEYKKVLFYYNKNLSIDGQMLTNRFLWRQKSGNRVDFFDYNEYLRGSYFWDLDLLKMLNGDGDFSRYY